MEVLKDLGATVRHGWQDLAENWRGLVHRGSSALTRFLPRPTGDSRGAVSPPQWAMLAGEVVDRGSSVVVQLELPGVRREDCKVTIEDGCLRVEGERRSEREQAGASYWLMERAYGGFTRVVSLPPEADPGSARAELRDGVLKVELKKKEGAVARRHQVQVQ